MKNLRTAVVTSVAIFALLVMILLSIFAVADAFGKNSHLGDKTVKELRDDISFLESALSMVESANIELKEENERLVRILAKGNSSE